DLTAGAAGCPYHEFSKALDRIAGHGDINLELGRTYVIEIADREAACVHELQPALRGKGRTRNLDGLVFRLLDRGRLHSSRRDDRPGRRVISRDREPCIGSSCLLYLNRY